MILKTDYNALVLVGIWNKGIFNPDWVSRFLLPKEKKLSVELPLNVDGSPRVSSDKIRIFVIGNKLNFVPLNTYNETFELIQDLATKTADYLPHTPVASFGVNFLFEADSTESLRELLKINDIEKLSVLGASIKNTQHRPTMELEGRLINLSISTDNSIMNFDFNFHFSISNLTEFKEEISANPILGLKETSLNILRNAYNLELDK